MTDLENFFRLYLACCNDHRLGDLDTFVHDPIRFNGTDTPLTDYKNAIGSFLKIFPDFHWTIENLIADGDTIAVRLTDTGTHQGDWLGLKPTGRVMTAQEMAFYRLREGKIAEMWYILDTPAITKQLEQS